MNDEELSDEEKSFNEWVGKNLDYISNNKIHLKVMKKLYMQGFAAGFQHKQKITAEEYLQK